MVLTHRKLCLKYLNCWGLLEKSSDFKDQQWLRAIQKTEAYYLTQKGSIGAIVLDLHFRQKMSETDTIKRSCIGRTTYQNVVTDIVSTLAVYAAQDGLLDDLEDGF